MKIVCDDRIPFLQGVFEPYAEVVYLPGCAISAADVKDADALVVRTRTRCDAALLSGSRVRIVATATIGFDHIDTAWCQSHGVAWVNAPGCNAGSVKHYLASVLCTLSDKLHIRLEDVVLGVVGVGHVGSRVAAVASALGCRVLCCDPPRVRQEPGLDPALFVPLDEVLRRANMITLHVPLTVEGEDATRHLFDAARLHAWLDHPRFEPLQASCRAVLINASRGPVVDNAALCDLMDSCRLGVVLDTWESEPDIRPDLLERSLVATPHIAGYSADGKANGTMCCVRAVASALGLPLTTWSPRTIPYPTSSCLTVPAGMPDTEVLKHCILHTYNVIDDDARLRAHPNQFEKLRGTYPLRRDIESYSVSLPATGNSRVGCALAAAGFGLA